MNFLAHIFLSGDDHRITVGNFIGDFVKGTQIDHYPTEIRKGILLHRSIDHYTDTHPVVLKSKERLRPNYRHYAPVIVDVFYDHFLAANWNQYSTTGLESYTHEFYQMIDGYTANIPADAVHMLSYMKRDNWLYNYRELAGINRALTGMARRTKFESGMENAAKDLEKNYEDFKDEFNAFFPQLRIHCQNFLDQHK